MFSKDNLDYLKQQDGYLVIRANHHDVTIHSLITGHDWIIVSNYETPHCYILHRHSGRYSYHRQRGRYKDLKDALDYIKRHDEWYKKQQ